MNQRGWLYAMTPPFLKCPKLSSKYETQLLMERSSPKLSHTPVPQAPFWALSHAKDMDPLQPTGPWAICTKPCPTRTTTCANNESRHLTHAPRKAKKALVAAGRLSACTANAFHRLAWPGGGSINVRRWDGQRGTDCSLKRLPANVTREGGQQNPRVL